MRAIFGADRYNSGEITLDGKKLQAYSPSRAIHAGMGFCTEDRKKEGLMLRLSILLNMTLVEISKFAKMGFVSKRKQEEVAMKYVESMSIKTPSVYQLVGNLSGGVLRHIAEGAGVHIYAHGDEPVYVNSLFLGVYSLSDTVLTVKEDGLYQDVFTGAVYEAKEKTLCLPYKGAASRLLVKKGDVL